MSVRMLFRIVALVVIGTLAALAEAQAEKPNLDAFLLKWDTDHDGTLTVEEIKKAADKRFEELDRKHGGYLTRSQLAGIVSFQQFRKADSAHGGKLDKAKFLSLVEKLFQNADMDHDGKLDQRELGSPMGKALLRLLSFVRQGPVI